MIIGGYDLNINVDSGIWSLGFDGSTGKTLLYNLINSASASSKYSADFLAITYDIKFSTEDYCKWIKNFTGKYIMLDRFDLYYHDMILKELLKKNACILLDLKNYSLWQKLPYHGCEIKFTSTNLEVNKI